MRSCQQLLSAATHLHHGVGEAQIHPSPPCTLQAPHLSHAPHLSQQPTCTMGWGKHRSTPAHPAPCKHPISATHTPSQPRTPSQPTTHLHHGVGVVQVFFCDLVAGSIPVYAVIWHGVQLLPGFIGHRVWRGGVRRTHTGVVSAQRAESRITQLSLGPVPPCSVSFQCLHVTTQGRKHHPSGLCCCCCCCQHRQASPDCCCEGCLLAGAPDSIDVAHGKVHLQQS
jgi:hypothetical protein